MFIFICNYNSSFRSSVNSLLICHVNSDNAANSLHLNLNNIFASFNKETISLSLKNNNFLKLHIDYWNHHHHSVLLINIKEFQLFIDIFEV